MKNIQSHLVKLARDWGIHPGNVQSYLEAEFKHDFGLACDAQPTLITNPNSAVPGYLLNLLDPDIITVLVAPMKIEKIIGARKKGSWTTKTAMFPIAESAGQVSSYGDYSNNGQATTNVNWVNRQSYHFQTITQWGEQELAIAGEGQIDYAARINISSTLILNKAMNKIGFFGVAGLENYGLLNDPSLPAPITPSGGTTWATKDAAAVYTDIQSIFQALVDDTMGLVEADTPMCLAMSPGISVNLTKTNQYNVNVYDQLKKNFPNIRFETAVEYSTASGELVQLIADNVGPEATDVAYSAFTEKMRAHPVIQKLSSFQQKKSAGSWGSILRYPIAFEQMLGV